MARTDINAAPLEHARSASPDEFPSLNYAADAGRNGRGGYRYGRDNGYHDPGRTRFATAVKRPAPAPVPTSPQVQSPKDPALIMARREAMGVAAEPLHQTSVVAPKPSPRLKLRPPTLLPTLPTGESVSQLYMAYRSR